MGKKPAFLKAALNEIKSWTNTFMDDYDVNVRFHIHDEQMTGISPWPEPWAAWRDVEAGEYRDFVFTLGTERVVRDYLTGFQEYPAFVRLWVPYVPLEGMRAVWAIWAHEMAHVLTAVRHGVPIDERRGHTDEWVDCLQEIQERYVEFMEHDKERSTKL